MSEKINFQAEVGKLLDIMINSIYSERQIFLRELISNASDACDKLQYLCLTNPESAKNSGEMKIKIIPKRFEMLFNTIQCGMTTLAHFTQLDILKPNLFQKTRQCFRIIYYFVTPCDMKVIYSINRG